MSQPDYVMRLPHMRVPKEVISSIFLLFEYHNPLKEYYSMYVLRELNNFIFIKLFEGNVNNIKNINKFLKGINGIQENQYNGNLRVYDKPLKEYYSNNVLKELLYSILVKNSMVITKGNNFYRKLFSVI